MLFVFVKFCVFDVFVYKPLVHISVDTVVCAVQPGVKNLSVSKSRNYRFRVPVVCKVVLIVFVFSQLHMFKYFWNWNCAFVQLLVFGLLKLFDLFRGVCDVFNVCNDLRNYVFVYEQPLLMRVDLLLKLFNTKRFFPALRHQNHEQVASCLHNVLKNNFVVFVVVNV